MKLPATLRALFAYLPRHPWQLAMAVLGVFAGVAVMVAVDVANRSAEKAFLRSMDIVTGAATHQLVGGPAGIDETLYRDLRVRHGLRNIAPVVEGEVVVDGETLPLMGLDLFAERDMRSFTGEAGADDAGTPPATLFRGLLTEPGTAMLSPATAAAFGLARGDGFDLVADGVTRRASVLGVFSEDAAAGLGQLIAVDIATAQHWLGGAGRLTRIDVRLPYGDDAARAALERLLPPGVRLLDAAGRTRTTADLAAAFMTNLTAMSLLALLVGLFLIYNSVSFSVLQRRRLIGILRALGVTRRQTVSLLLTEAAVIGLAAAAAGVVAGSLLGERLLVLVSQSINDLYFRVSVTEVSVSATSILKGIAAGTAAATFAAAVPAIEASGWQPRLAMSRSTLEQRSVRLLPLLSLAGGLTVALAVVVLLVSGRSLVAGLAAVFLLIFGFALFVPALVRLSTKRLLPLAGRIGGTVGRIAVADIAASLSRTGVAIVALAVAVAATIGVQVMVSSFRASVSEWLDQSLAADIYVGLRRGELDPALVRDLGRVAGVAEVSTSRRAWLEDERGRTQLHAIRMAPGSYAGTEILGAEPDAAWAAFRERDAVLVSEPYAYSHGVRPGGQVTLATAAGNRAFDVAAIYKSYDVNASAVMMSRATYDRYWDDDGVDALGIYLDDDAHPERVIRALEATAAGRQDIEVNSNLRLRELSLEVFDRTFRITDVLYWLTLGVAFIGILGAMLALELERARELATLRALGMTPAQIGGMVTAQTGVIGLLSGIAAIPLGLVMAWVLIEVINRRAFGWQIDMQVAGGILVSAVAFAVLAAMAAGLYPSWRAAKSQPAAAMREE